MMNTSNDEPVVEGHRLPAALVASINSGRWMSYRQLGRSQLEQIFAGERPPERGSSFFDIEMMTKMTAWWKNEPSAFYQTGPPGSANRITAENGLVVGDIGDGEALFALDYSAEPPAVKILSDNGWVVVASTIDDLLFRLEAAMATTSSDPEDVH